MLLGTEGEALLQRVLARILWWRDVDAAFDERLQAIDDLTAIVRQQVEPKRRAPMRVRRRQDAA
ncbi:MAG TPA: hypothetical protein VGQ62_14065 [Chloroflexota bacterium]|nr:hypothetical protein [Chloroflexota bacterium]